MNCNLLACNSACKINIQENTTHYNITSLNPGTNYVILVVYMTYTSDTYFTEFFRVYINAHTHFRPISKINAEQNIDL